jgi:phosphoribosylformylglycinamidine (FGAM) synthase-like amidotransferase family enzyme
MKVGVVTFPGSLDDQDAARAVRFAGATPVSLWHRDSDLHGVDAVILPGGFSYGDYLRCGAISRFAPVMTSIIEQAKSGLPVLGICNGFQIKVCTFFVDRKKSASKIPQAHGHLILFKTKKLSSLSKTEKDLFNVMTQHWLNSKAKAE